MVNKQLKLDDPSILRDLQRVSPEELMKVKEKMEEHFQAHFISSDDPRYVHDKVIDFEATEENEWDE